MSVIRVLGIDPGLAACGYVVVEVDTTVLRGLPHEGYVKAVTILRAGVWRTKSESKAGMAKVRKCDVKAERVTDLAQRCHQALLWSRNTGVLVLGQLPLVMAVEEFTPGRPCGGPMGHAISAAGNSVMQVVGAFQGVAAACACPFLAVHPSETKKLVTGNAVSTKADVYAVRGTDLEAVADCGAKSWPASCNQHVGDALAVAVAAVRTVVQRSVF